MFFVREKVQSKSLVVVVAHIAAHEQVAEILTRALSKQRFIDLEQS